MTNLNLESIKAKSLCEGKTNLLTSASSSPSQLQQDNGESSRSQLQRSEDLQALQQQVDNLLQENSSKDNLISTAART